MASSQPETMVASEVATAASAEVTTSEETEAMVASTVVTSPRVETSEVRDARTESLPQSP